MMMKNKSFLLSIFAFVVFIPFTTKHFSKMTNAKSELLKPEIQDCGISNTVFQDGEKITYKIYYNLNFVWVAAGEVTFRVLEETDQYHFKASGKTNSSYEWFYKVNDAYESWVPKNTLFPTYSTRSISEGKYTNYEKVSYDQAAKKTTVWRAKKKDDPETETQHTVQDCVHDLVSVVYYLRNLDFSDKKSGYSTPVRAYLDKEEYPLNLKFQGRRAKKRIHGMGNYKCLQFEPEIIAGNVFKEGDKMQVWVSDDENKIPLLIESPVSVGSIKMVMKDYWGLKFPFTAKVD
jgi:Protein of unknown function (DUF3108)